MTELEKCIFEGALKSQKDYVAMTDGYWLWHGPESFTQTIIAEELSKTGHTIYIDASIKKLMSDLERGPGPSDKGFQTTA